MPGEPVSLTAYRDRRQARELLSLAVAPLRRHDGACYAATVVDGCVVFMPPADADGSESEWWLGPAQARELAGLLNELAGLAEEQGND